MNREEELEFYINMSENSKLPLINITRLNWIIELADIKINKCCKGFRRRGEA